MQGTPLFQNAPPERFEIHPRAERPLGRGFRRLRSAIKGAAGFRPSLCEDKLRKLPRAKAALGTGQFDYGDVLARPCVGVFLSLYPADPHRIAREPRHISLL